MTSTGLALLQNAVEHLDRSPARLEDALALIDYGAAMRRRGHVTPLRRGPDIAAADFPAPTRPPGLTASGIRIRRDTQTGIGALTPSERRITVRAASGATNPQIAQALFITGAKPSTCSSTTPTADSHHLRHQVGEQLHGHPAPRSRDARLNAEQLRMPAGGAMAGRVPRFVACGRAVRVQALGDVAPTGRRPSPGACSVMRVIGPPGGTAHRIRCAP